MKIHVGTSGWNYQTFRGIIYPEDMPERQFLQAYAEQFDTVELNASFYRSFPVKTWHKWYANTPSGFIWSVKGHRYITHIKRLSPEPESVSRFMERCRLLREKLGVLLWQLPPSLPYDRDLLLHFLSMLPPGYRYAIEARHDSWHRQEVLETLHEQEISWVISETAGRYPMTLTATTDLGYIRLHGHSSLYRGEYGRERLERLREKILSLDISEAFIYFDNTDDGSAIKDALMFREILQP